MSGSASILFLEKVFLRKRKTDEALRGVELFNLWLVRDLLALGHPVTFPLHPSWLADAERVAGRAAFMPASGPAFLAAWLTARHTAGIPHDILLLGNVGNGLIPAIRLLHRSTSFTSCVLIAHREASHRFLRATAPLPGHVVAVNGVIADAFRRAGHPHVHVDYGIMNADRFRPVETTDATDKTTRFCVLGAMDNAWKGADTAVQAFHDLPLELREKAELHLYSFRKPPSFPGQNITAHGWIAADDVPGMLRSMDVLLVPSRDEEVMRETFSQAMVQGMLTGLPSIVSDLPILNEKLDKGGGLVCRDVREFTQAMSELIQRPDTRRTMGAAARATALKRYVWSTERFAKRYFAP